MPATFMDIAATKLLANLLFYCEQTSRDVRQARFRFSVSHNFTFDRVIPLIPTEKNWRSSRIICFERHKSGALRRLEALFQRDIQGTALDIGRRFVVTVF